MNLLRALSVLIISILLPAAAQQSPPIAWEIRSQTSASEVEINPATGEITAPNGVVISYRDVNLTAKKITANQQTGEVLAEGSVTINGRDHFWTGERAVYNFSTGLMSADNFRTGQDPFFVGGARLLGDQSNSVYSAGEGYLTTDNFSDPAYRLRAKSIYFSPGKFIEAHGATLYLGSVPVFYFPYYRRSLGPHPNHFSFTPGYRSSWGPYLLSTYHWYLNDTLDGGLHFDLRERRGLAGGPEVNFHLGPYGDGSLLLYYARDTDPSADQILVPPPPDRKRIAFTYQANIQSNFTAKAVVRYQSDAQVVRDFFESEYRKNVQPASFLELDKVWSNWTLNALVQARVNQFYETVERLPDLKLTGLRQQIGETPLFYESDSSFGYFHRRFADDFTPDFAAWRGDTFHQILWPNTFFGWLNFTPRVGGRFTSYSQTEGPGAVTTEQNRGVFNTGAEISFKASRVWKNVENSFLEIHELRHIFEPSINYVFVPAPNVSPSLLPQFDYEIPSLRLLPIEFPDYNSVDAIDSQNVLRFTLLNRLQTKRADGIMNVVNWALYTDWRLRPRPGQDTFADLFSDLNLRPRSWLALFSQVRFGLHDERVSQSNHRLVVLPNDVWSVSLGHYYVRQDVARFGPDPGHNTIYDSIFYRFNENWGARVAHHFEARDGVMEEQYYTLYRDLRSWTAALTFRHRQNRVGKPDDFTVAITVSLKAIPKYALGADSDRPDLLLGR